MDFNKQHFLNSAIFTGGSLPIPFVVINNVLIN